MPSSSRAPSSARPRSTASEAVEDEPRSRADGQREKVLEAAARIFSRRGYRGTTMTDIAVEVGLRKPSLYHYFRNKEELLVRLYEGVMDENMTTARAIVASSSSPREALRELLINRVSYTCRHREILTVFFEEEAELPPAMAESLLARRREFEDIFISVVNAALARSSEDFSVPVRVYVNTCLGAAIWVYKWYNPQGDLSPDELGQEIADLLLKALPE